MGLGFIITIILLAALLGIFSRQVLSTNETKQQSVPSNHSDDNDHHDSPHFRAM
jgi:hypothetical protein